MKKIILFIHSSIGMKIIMALTGLLMILFLLGHVSGNLLIFSGQESINRYAHWLQNNPLLWFFRLGMLFLLSLHLYLAIRTHIQNRRARTTGYALHKDIQLGFSAKTMIVSGILILGFIVFHIMHLTLGWVIETEQFGQLDKNGLHDVYHNLVMGFQHIWVSFIYLLALLLIALHLHHAFKSLFQTLGFHHQNFHYLLAFAGPVLNGFIILAFMLIPIAVMFNFIPILS